MICETGTLDVVRPEQSVIGRPCRIHFVHSLFPKQLAVSDGNGLLLLSDVPRLRHPAIHPQATEATDGGSLWRLRSRDDDDAGAERLEPIVALHSNLTNLKISLV